MISERGICVSNSEKTEFGTFFAINNDINQTQKRTKEVFYLCVRKKLLIVG